MANKTKETVSGVSVKAIDENTGKIVNKPIAESIAEEQEKKDNGTQTFVEGTDQKVTEAYASGAAEMDNDDPTKLVKVDIIETPLVRREVRITDENIKGSQYTDLIERYKTSNPKKYEAKKAELERKAAEMGAKLPAKSKKEDK